MAKRYKPGPGWHRLGPCVYEAADGTRVHSHGVCRLPDHEWVDGTLWPESRTLWRFVRINGGNTMRGAMAWANELRTTQTKTDQAKEQATMRVKPGDEIRFRGCMWEAYWEFDAPCVLYSPVKRYSFGGNSGEIMRMVENICINLAGGPVEAGWCESDLREFKWRGWSPRGFAKRRNAWHREIVVRFGVADSDGHLGFEVIDDKEWWGRDEPD